MFRVTFAIGFALFLCSGLFGQDRSAIRVSKESAKVTQERPLHAKNILGNPDCLAFCYGGYRGKTRDESPTVDQLKEDLRILSTMGVKIVRTYNTQQYAMAANLLKAIQELGQDNDDFEMYVMLGAWIECESAWTKDVNHEAGHVKNNTAEIKAAISLAKQYPDIVRVIAVGNEAMVHWASSYYVRPAIILHWVNHLQGLKKSGELPSEIWITSSDNYAAWGGADASYHSEDLKNLIAAVDYVSLHTYPFHDTYHTPKFWIAPAGEEKTSIIQQTDAAVSRAQAFAVAQYQSTADYIKRLGIAKPIHIGETGWASTDSAHYGAKGSQAADEYKAGRFYDAMRDWTNKNGITCFYFEAFDEQWKDLGDVGGSENHFGLINMKGEAKYVLWDEVDAGMFAGLKRDGVAITKTHGGNAAMVTSSILQIPTVNNLGGLAIATVNSQRTVGEVITESKYVILHDALMPTESNDMTYPSELLKLNVWEGTCGMQLLGDAIHVTTGTGEWWGCALEIQGDGKGENLSQFKSGQLNFEIRGKTRSNFQLGFQTGMFNAGTQENCHVKFGPKEAYKLSEQWKTYSIPISKFANHEKAKLTDVTGLLFVKSENGLDGEKLEIKNVHWSSR